MFLPTHVITGHGCFGRFVFQIRRVSPLFGQPGGHGGAYGGGVPRLGGAPPYPPGGARRRQRLAPALVQTMVRDHLLLQSSRRRRSVSGRDSKFPSRAPAIARVDARGDAHVVETISSHHRQTRYRVPKEEQAGFLGSRSSTLPSRYSTLTGKRSASAHSIILPASLQKKA